MKTPVLDLKDYIKFLNKNKEDISKEMQKVLSPEEVKKKTLEATSSNKSNGLVTMKEVLDSIKNEAYYKGQLGIIEHLLSSAEQHLKKFENV